MPHHLLSKKIWIAIVVLIGTFMGMAYIWMYYTDQGITQIELTEHEQVLEQTEEEEMNIGYHAEESVWYTEDTTGDTLVENREIVFPCILRMQQEQIGIYTAKGNLIRELIQVGELLSINDQGQLRQGIRIENEKELILALESYHLQ